MAREGTATPVDPGLIARLVQGVRYAISGVKPDSWFGPGQPLPPVAQEQARGRQFDFSVNVNMRQQPRVNESVSFEQMRGLADSYDLLRLVIETRKDQMCSLEWSIRPQAKNAEPDERCARIEAFLQMPDQEHNWQTWLRMLLEDMLVLDAATVFPRRTVGGEPWAFELIDGATIKRVISEDGRTPMPPDPAFQQVIKGLPAVNYSRDELIYAIRNPRTNRVYGYSPVEQIIMTVNIALRRQLHQLQYYTEGNVPEAFIGVPDSWNPDQIRMFQDYWDAMLEGNTAQRRHAKFIPGGMDVVQTRGNDLKDMFDEWLARIVCFAFSISPNAFIAQVNRSTAEVSKATADEEGVRPTCLWVKSVMDVIIARWFGCPDLCFSWADKQDVDAKTKAEINAIYLRSKVVTPDEVRADLGLDPLTDEQRTELFPSPPPQLAAFAGQPNNGPPDDSEPPEDAAGKYARLSLLHASAGRSLGKAGKSVAPIDRERPAIGALQTKLQTVVAEFLSKQAPKVIDEVIAAREALGKSAADDIKRILETLNLGDWEKLLPEIEPLLRAMVAEGGEAALLQVGLSGDLERLLSLVNEYGVEYAKTAGSELIKNISEATRNMIRSDIAAALESGHSNDQLAATLKDNHAFSPQRAEVIARTETAFADVAGNLRGYKESGVVARKQWIVGAGCCDLCDELNGETIPLDEQFDTEDGPIDGPPLHPNCRCDVLPILSGDEPGN